MSTAAKRPSAVADPDLRPSTVVTAFWLAVATAIASLLLNGLGLVQSAGRIAPMQQSAVRAGAPGAQAQTSVLGPFVVVAVIALLYSVLLVVFARRMRQGRSAARIVVTMLAALSLLSILGFGIGAITGLLAAFTVVFAWLPATSDWFRTARRPLA